jgi:hypothetical protein
MHSCLKLVEIQRIIVESLDRENSTFRSDLLALATSCSLLCGTALDELWREQSSLLPLILTMPDDVWEKRPVFSDLFTLVGSKLYPISCMNLISLISLSNGHSWHRIGLDLARIRGVFSSFTRLRTFTPRYRMRMCWHYARLLRMVPFYPVYRI